MFTPANTINWLHKFHSTIEVKTSTYVQISSTRFRFYHGVQLAFFFIFFVTFSYFKKKYNKSLWTLSIAFLTHKFCKYSIAVGACNFKQSSSFKFFPSLHFTIFFCSIIHHSTMTHNTYNFIMKRYHIGQPL